MALELEPTRRTGMTNVERMSKLMEAATHQDAAAHELHGVMESLATLDLFARPTINTAADAADLALKQLRHLLAIEAGRLSFGDIPTPNERTEDRGPIDPLPHRR